MVPKGESIFFFFNLLQATCPGLSEDRFKIRPMTDPFDLYGLLKRVESRLKSQVEVAEIMNVQIYIFHLEDAVYKRGSGGTLCSLIVSPCLSVKSLGLRNPKDLTDRQGFISLTFSTSTYLSQHIIEHRSLIT